MKSQRHDVVIVGGGVIGLASAYELSRRGASVTVIDRGDFGYGCSYGNAGWLTPCFALPLPMPGMLLKSIGWLLNPDSPLHIKPAANLLLADWLLRFLRSMNSKLMHESVAALTEISKYSLVEYAKLDAESGGSTGFSRKGLFMVAQSKGGVKAAIEEMELVAPHGIPGKWLDEKESRQLEPSLTGPILGGVYFPEEAHAEPLAIVRALAEGAKKNGATFLPKTELFDFVSERGAIRSLRTTRGEIRADQVVLATGSWSYPIARSIGIHVPVMGGKGYAWIVKPFTPTPSIPMMLIEKKVAVTPRDGTVRLAGTLELVDRDESITRRRAAAILNGAREFLNVPQDPEFIELWRGLRPCTPDGVPIIGRPKAFGNLLIATGHQMLGLQSAPGTGRLVADLVLGETPAFDPHPFRADRF